MKKSSVNIMRVFADYPVLCTVIGALAWFTFSAFEMFGSANEFYYIDTDCYARYLRITDWLSGDFSWFEKIFPFTNCPHGEVLHFTRINDILWLIFSLPFFAFLPLKSAIFAGGLIFSPILFAITLALVISGLKKYIGAKDFAKPALFVFVFGFIFLLKSMVFEFGRPDHHSLMILLTAFLSITLLNPSNKKMFLSGVAGALGIWASSAFEGMLLAYAFLAVLCIGIVFYKQNFEWAYRYTFGLFFGVLIAYLLNPPFEGYFYFDNARLSLIHVVICGLTFAVFALCRYFNPRKTAQKIVAISSGALISFAVLACAFGFKAVFAPVYDEKVSRYFVAYISEMKPVLPQEIWYFVLGSVECLFLCRHFKRFKFGDVAIYALFFIYLPFAVMLRRFMPYGILFFVLINSLFLSELFKYFARGEKYKWSALICIAFNIAIAVSFDYAVVPAKASYPRLEGCALTDLFFAPQLIYKTGVTTVGSPYHRNVDGIVDNVEIFSSTDEKEILQKLSERKVKYIIIPNENIIGKRLYLKDVPNKSLYRSLQDGKQYDWLKMLNSNDESYLFYEIKNNDNM